MKIVKRYPKDSAPSVIRSVTKAEESVIFISSKEQQEFFQSLYGTWLLCECNLPVTVKRLRVTNQYYLAKVQGREQHQPSCHFFSLVDERENSTDALAKGNTNSFSFSLNTLEAGERGVTETSDRVNKVARSDKLYSLLANLVENAQTNSISMQRPPSFAREVEQLRNTAQRFNLGGKSLKEYIFFGFGQYQSAVGTLKKRQSSWIGRHKPQALLLAHVEAITIDDDNQCTVHVKEGWDVKLPVKCLVTRMNGFFSLKRGPLLLAGIISQIGKDDENQPQYGISRCFITPVVNNTGFMLVDSDLERIAAKVAIKCMLTNKSNSKLSKPLIPVFVEGTAVLPDFLVHFNGTNNVIEVMGKWDDPIYQERKSRTVPLMEKLYGEVKMLGTSTSKNPDEYYKECVWLFNQYFRT